MSDLKTIFDNEMNSRKDAFLYREADCNVGYPTGLLNLDYKNGCNIISELKDGSMIRYNSIGLVDGSYVLFIGKPGTGKTTFAIQAACRIAELFPDSMILHDDLERASTRSRIMQVSGWSPRMLKDKYSLRNSGITCETFFQRIMTHATVKIKNRDKFSYNTGYIDEFGNPIVKLIPTIYILDSLPLLVPNNSLDESGELSGQMATTSAAKLNAYIFRRLTQVISQANILLFVINHITKKVEINPFAKSQAQVNYMSQDEQLPGGETPIFLANNIFKFTSYTKFTSEDEFGLDGFLSKIKLLKSRTNKAGQEVISVYSQEYGFRNELTLFNELKEHKILQGTPRAFYLPSAYDIKFTKKNFFDKFHENEDLRRALLNDSLPILRKYINKNNSEDNRSEKEILSDVFEDMNSDFSGGENYDDFLSELKQNVKY